MNKYVKEFIRCSGYYIVMVILTLVMIPAKAQAPLLRISAIVIGAALLINIFSMILGGDQTSFSTRIARHLTSFIFISYVLLFLVVLLFDQFGELLLVITHAFQ